MYMPPAFRDEDRDSLFATIHAARLANLVTATAEGPQVSPLPLLLDESEGEFGTLYGHLARANAQWRLPVIGEAVAVFMGPDAYITPGWYATKRRTGKDVPTWNYVTVHAHGPLVVRDDAAWLEDVVRRLSERHEAGRDHPWSVDDAPRDYVESQLRAIMGVEMRITRLEAKRKLSQNRIADDMAGVVAGLAQGSPEERAVATEMRKETPRS